MSSTGIDRRTGAVLTGLDHVRQSVAVILTTRIGSRVMRRTFGAAVPALLMRENLTAEALARFLFAVTVAIDAWEPRLRVVQVVCPAPPNAAPGLRLGSLALAVLCSYRPHALQGDTTTDVREIWL